jgi:hypothetical protein
MRCCLFMFIFCLLAFTKGFSTLKKPQLRVKEVLCKDINDPYFNKEIRDVQDIYPKNMWAWDRPPAKKFLTAEEQKAWANPLVLNIIELVHWLSFPIGFYIAYYIFMNMDIIKLAVDNDRSRVFFLMLGLLSQVFGGAGPIMMHMYEGWQVTPFHNIVQFDATPTPLEIEAIRIQNGNNGWLRGTALTLLTGFQNLGLGLINLGVYGYHWWTLGAIVLSLFFSLIGPKTPILPFSRKNKFNPDVSQPFLPIPVSVFVGLMINSIINLFASVTLFYDALVPAWPPTYLPFLSVLSPQVGALISSLASPLLIAVGGAYEGVFAETTFLQWQHLLAFVILLTGLGLGGATYWHLVQFLQLQ